MAERLGIGALVAAFSAWHWRQLERPEPAIAELAGLILLAAAPAVLAGLGRRRLAIAAAIAAVPTAIWVGFDYLPWQRNHPFYPIRLGEGLRDGARAWFDTATPFDPGRFPATEGMVVLSFFLLLATFAWLLVDGRHGLAAVAAAFALFAIPSTSLDMGEAGLRAAIFLLLALAVLAVCQHRVPAGAGAIGQLTALAAATVVAGLVIASAPGVAKGAFFDWRHWNPLSGGGPRVSVGFVWNQDYGPLIWPRKTTTVFEVSSNRPHYWKAAILNDFIDDRWVPGVAIQGLFHQQRSIDVPPQGLPSKATHPDKRSDITQITVKVDALADPHLLSTGQPLRYDTGTPIDASLATDGSLVASSDPVRGAAYSVRAYAPDPTPKQLAGAGTRFPSSVVRTLVVNGVEVPLWESGGSSGPVRVPIDARLIEAANQVWSRSGASDPTSSEYGVVAAVESYFQGAQFHYDQTPPPPPDHVPVLADFMMRSHRGYCQMFSGAMALVLRLHGIPARVAVGFTEGKLTSLDHYTVTDRDAHSWVEVYFPGYGWIPFEPTKTRSLPIQTSTTNKNWALLIGDRKLAAQFGIPGTLVSSRLSKAQILEARHGLSNISAHKGGRGNAGGVVVVPAGSRGHSFFLWAVSAVAVVIALLTLVKLAAVRWRYLRRGPRGQASAAYHELATYVGDQGLRVAANATFEDLARVIDHTWAVDVSALAAAGSAARYAPPDVAERAGRELRPALRRVRRDLRKSIDLRDRLTGALRLRSVLAQTTHLE